MKTNKQPPHRRIYKNKTFGHAQYSTTNNSKMKLMKCYYNFNAADDAFSMNVIQINYLNGMHKKLSEKNSNRK